MDIDKQGRIAVRSIDSTSSILRALKLMDELDCKLLLVTKDDLYCGLLSIGDIQRAIIANHALETGVGDILREDIRTARCSDSLASIKEMMLEFRMEFIPVLDEQNLLVNAYFWEDIFLDRPPSRNQINTPVVIMAGGQGSRLKPFSNILPKPLFPIGEKTIAETIIDRFVDAGCSRFLMSINYRADFIESYFGQHEHLRERIEFFRETKPLGTAGSLHLIRDRIQETFFVSNCDIIVDTDYSEVVDYHRRQGNEITLVAALKHLRIPYGTLETGEGGQLIQILEKPEHTYLINAGMYLLEPNLLAEIPENRFFHITDLIEQIIARGGKAGVFPVSEKSWFDIGELHQYDQTIATLTKKNQI